jgi:hypothetical protein
MALASEWESDLELGRASDPALAQQSDSGSDPALARRWDLESARAWGPRLVRDPE